MATAAGDAIVDAELFVVEQHPSQRGFGVGNGITRGVVFGDVGRFGLVGVIGQIIRVDRRTKFGFDGGIGIGGRGILLAANQTDHQ